MTDPSTTKIGAPKASAHTASVRDGYHALALFSGGLDSILAMKLLQAQGLRVLGLHCVSPFFGHPDRIAHWRRVHGLDIIPLDVGEAYVEMLLAGPRYGLGKCLNPCVDCKIFMLSRARTLLPAYGASFLATGEVIGQRPMSQRRDALNAITREAGVREVLLRPLSAQSMEPTPMETSGLVDRSRLLDLYGRGRSRQLALAEAFGVTEIPTPAGGCRLTEKESCRRYFPLLAPELLGVRRPRPADFALANEGRQLWAGTHWYAMGRNRADNLRLADLALPGDLVLRLADHPGPLGVARPLPGAAWDAAAVRRAAALLASYATKAVTAGGPVRVRVGNVVGASEPTALMMDEMPPVATWDDLEVAPAREAGPGELAFAEPTWEDAKRIKRTLPWRVPQGARRAAPEATAEADSQAES